ncbi:hypothetical protein ABZV80_45265, partial [Streptomyces sp. NPDC005132]
MSQTVLLEHWRRVDPRHWTGTVAGGVVSNNCGAMESGLAVLLAAGRIARVTGSYIGANKE